MSSTCPHTLTSGETRVASAPEGQVYAESQSPPSPGAYITGFNQEGAGNQEVWEDSAKSSGFTMKGKIQSALAEGSGQSGLRAKDELQQYKADLKMTRENHERTLMELGNYKAELQRTQGEYRVSRRLCHNLQSETHRLKDVVQNLQHELSNVQRKFEDAKALSETRYEELQVSLIRPTENSLSIPNLIQAETSLGGSLVQSERDLSDDGARGTNDSPMPVEVSASSRLNPTSDETRIAAATEDHTHADSRSPPAYSTGYHQEDLGNLAKSSAPKIIDKVESLHTSGSGQSRGTEKFETEKHKDDFERAEGDRDRLELDNYKAQLHIALGEYRVSRLRCHDLESETQTLKHVVQGLQQELVNIERKFEDAKTLSEFRGDLNHKLKDLAQGVRNELNSVQSNFEEAKALSESRSNLNQKLNDIVRDLQQELILVQGKFEEAKALSEFRGDLNQKLKDVARGFQLELNNVQRKYENSKSSSEIPGNGRQGVQNFLTDQADSLTISDLIQKVASVNEEIFQTAASLGESIVRRKWDLSKEDAEKLFDSSWNMIGRRATALIYAEAQKKDAEINILLVQVVLQILLTSFCARRIQHWTPNDLMFNRGIRALYHEIRGSSKDQAVSGRWRALTLAHLNPDTHQWKDVVMQWLAKIMKIASWDIGTPEQLGSFVHRLLPIFTATIDLRVSLGQKFSSADIEISSFAPGSVFSKTEMEESYGDDRRKHDSHEKVLATVGLGLHKVMLPSSTPPFEFVVLPKVVLESSLRAALVPAPSPQSRSRRRENERKKLEAVVDERRYQDGRD